MKKYFYIATIAAFMLSGCEDFFGYRKLYKEKYWKFPETD